MNESSSGEDPRQVMFVGDTIVSHDPPPCCRHETVPLNWQMACNGSNDGIDDGSDVLGAELIVGLPLGSRLADGNDDGATLTVGDKLGCRVGNADGDVVSIFEGVLVGCRLGNALGLREGSKLGKDVGDSDT